MEILFPTKKPHVSYSEVKTWKDCPWKHFKSYIEKIGDREPNIYAEFGTAVHSRIEDYLETKVMKIDGVDKDIEKLWKEYGFDTDEYIKKITEDWAKFGIKYRHNKISKWIKSAENILESLPKAMEEQFGEWEFVASEYNLYESIDDYSKENLHFKGFIDAIIKTKVRGKDKYWIIDWKTCGPRGWNQEKRRDFYVQAQVGLYKHYYSKKYNIPLRSIGCMFGLLKRDSKLDKCIWFVPVSVGPKFVTKADNLVNKMLTSVDKGLRLKNRK